MKNTFLSVWKQLAQGKTPMRSLMNHALSERTLSGPLVLDVGGGKTPSYFNYLARQGEPEIVTLDKQYGKGTVDFEKDQLPYADGAVDQVLVLNVLEHIYNHRFLVSEIYRVLKPGGTVIGFVPFLINVHRDPHDFFRYTDEALTRIFSDAGFTKVKISTVGRGPFAVHASNLASFMPRIFNTAIWPFAYVLDAILLALKPNFRERFPLGYLFDLSK